MKKMTKIELKWNSRRQKQQQIWKKHQIPTIMNKHRMKHIAMWIRKYIMLYKKAPHIFRLAVAIAIATAVVVLVDVYKIVINS